MLLPKIEQIDTDWFAIILFHYNFFYFNSKNLESFRQDTAKIKKTKTISFEIYYQVLQRFFNIKKEFLLTGYIYNYGNYKWVSTED